MRYALAPFKLVFRNSWIWAGGVLNLGGVLQKGEGIRYLGSQALNCPKFSKETTPSTAIFRDIASTPKALETKRLHDAKLSGD